MRDIDSETQKVRDIVSTASEKIKSDELITFYRLPPWLMYIQPIATSKWQLEEDLPDLSEQGISDFSVFQVAYTGENKWDDIEQLMPMNSDFLARQTKLTLQNMQLVCDLPTFNFFQAQVLPKSSLLTKLHTELHNYGHFLGSWPYSSAQKNCDDYEGVEEYRACLAAVACIEHLDISEVEKDAFALLVVCTRIFCLGLVEYKRPEQEKTRQAIREISVGVFFFECLKNACVLKLVDGKVVIKVESIRAALKQELSRIHLAEKYGKDGGYPALRAMAILIYASYYPNGNISSELESVYSQFTLAE